MAPRRGGSGGSGGGSSDDGPDFCYNDGGGYYSCHDGLFYMYGDFYGSLYSNSELYSQLILYAIWSLLLICLLWMSFKNGARILQVAMMSLLISLAFLCTRLGLLIAQSDVPIAYRYESSIVVLTWHVALILLLAAVISTVPGKIWKIGLWVGFGVLASLNVAYIILDFIISSRAVEAYKYLRKWTLTDRDFGLTLTRSMLQELDTSTTIHSDNYSFLYEKLYDAERGEYEYERAAQIKIGVTIDFLALFLVCTILLSAALELLRQKEGSPRKSTTPLIAAYGLLLSTIFHLVITTHFVLNNWHIEKRLRELVGLDDGLSAYDSYYYGGFLSDYRTTVNGFPIVKAIIEPLGIVFACAMMVRWLRAKAKRADQNVYSP